MIVNPTAATSFIKKQLPIRLSRSMVAVSNFLILMLMVLTIMMPGIGSSKEPTTAKEIVLQFGSVSERMATPFEAPPPPIQRFAVARSRQLSGPPPRQRSLELSAESLVVVAMDAEGYEIYRVVVPDPRWVRAEDFSPTGEITSSKKYYRSGGEFPVVVPDDARIVKLKILQPRWTGADFVLELLGEVEVP